MTAIAAFAWITTFLFVVATVWLVRTLQERWNLDSVFDVLVYVAAVTLPRPTRPAPALLRAIRRRLVGLRLVGVTGKPIAYGRVDVRVAPHDLTRLLEYYGDGLADDLAKTYWSTGTLHGWRLPRTRTVVRLVDDPVLHDGWIRMDGYAGRPADSQRPEGSQSLPPGTGTRRVITRGRARDLTRHVDASVVHAQDIGNGTHTSPQERVGGRRGPVTQALTEQSTKRVRALRGLPVTRPLTGGPIRPSLFLEEVGGGSRTASFAGAAGVVGRGSSCDLELRDELVSRQHVRLEWSEDHWQLNDLSSTNGTFVDARRVTGAVQLAGGEILSFAERGPKFRVRLGSRTAGAMQPSAVDAPTQ